jgi:NADPH:quinone reductase
VSGDGERVRDDSGPAKPDSELVRAALCCRLGPISGVEVTEIPHTSPGPDDVEVAVRAAAVNFPDVLIVAGTYQAKIEPPFVPGSEFAGDVVAVGERVENVRVGDRVLGTVFVGAFAERIVLPARSVQTLPAALDYVEGSAFKVAYTTAFHSLLTIGEAQPGDTVVVLGAAGGVGLAAVDIAHRLGMRVVAVASSAERVALAMSRGADAGVDYSREPVKERLKDLTGGGADVVVDPVGGDLSELAFRATRWGARFVSVGFAAGEIPRIPLNLVLLKGAHVRGFELRGVMENVPGAVRRGDAALSQLVAGGMRPYVSSTHPLERVRDALDEVAGRRALGKVVVTMAS